MNYLKKMFDMQKVLDSRIKEEHQLQNKFLFEDKVLALLVELGELANETRCFKFWSKKPSAPQEAVLEEYVDNLHFILSIGLELGLEQHVRVEELPADGELVEQFHLLYGMVHVFRQSKGASDYQQLVNEFFRLGKLLGFSLLEIDSAYHQKNEINHTRQDNGY